MRTYFLLIGLIIISIDQATAQRTCGATLYLQNEIHSDPQLANEMDRVESFVRQQITSSQRLHSTSRLEGNSQVIKVPVVVHILYHLPGENISDSKVYEQISMLNQCYRRTNSDSSNTPVAFKSRAADCEIEFQLATSDPQKRNTTGIIHKYTPITVWQGDDQMKFSSQMGDDAWDPASYLNIWVCNLNSLAGYASVPGSTPSKDGVVIRYGVFGTNGTSGYELGRTTVHEVGHWLGLKHIWGDSDCGDDLVDDTPPQASYTTGCPTGVRISCNDGPTGEMYMNYMDYTNDACINLFTAGQKARMRALFAPGGIRYPLLSSNGLNPPLFNEVPVPDEPPTWLHPQLYPNPANDELILDVSYDVRWVGQMISLANINGQQLMRVMITSKVQHIDVSRLRPGVYFISIKNEDGSYIKQKFIKM